MEERPSDSPNESANELPQSVPQPPPTVPVITDESAVTQRSEDTVVSDSITSEQPVNEQPKKDKITDDQVATEEMADQQSRTDRGSINQTESELYVNTSRLNDSGKAEQTRDPQGTDDEITSNSPIPGQNVTRSDTQERVTVGQNEDTALGAEPTAPSELNRPNQARSRDGQPRQNQSGQPGNQTVKQNQPRADKPGQERSENDRQGQNKQRDTNQLRQQPNQRDPNQPQKQGQLGQERGDSEKQGQPNQPRQQNSQPTGQEKQREGNQSRQQTAPPARTNQPGNERSGQERTGQSRQSRDAGSTREVEFDGGDDLRSNDFRQPDRTPAGPREETGRESDNRLTIGITLGDYNGIGPEVILKALQHNRLQKICTPVIYGSMRVLNRYRNLLELKDWNLNGIQQVEQASHKLTNVITCWADQNQEIQPGKVTAEAGQAAFACLQRAVEDLREGKLDAIVTAPINKHNIQSEEFTFPGHTEYLAEAFSVADNLMFMVSERLRVGVVTGHVPLGRVRQNITRERILQKLTMMSQSLRLDFGIDKPRIAVLGLNPHAGEEGLLGNEEQEIVKPLIKQLQDKGNLVYGPFPADGFFGTRAYLKFDAVLAMYHDQGLIPFKAIAFEEGVNFTAAMPIVRTSPDHGTAYDIAGKNLADETSMLQAIYTACDIARRRRETAEINAGALKPKRERAVEK